LQFNLYTNLSRTAIEFTVRAEMANPKVDEARKNEVVDDDEPDEWFVSRTPLRRTSHASLTSAFQG
jgi:hypothetical protein